MLFGGPIISSTEALELTEVPGRLAVVGAGYIGLELGTAFAKLGAAVTIVEAQADILPQYDAELTRPVGQAPARSRDRGPHGRDGEGARQGRCPLDREPGRRARHARRRHDLVTVGRRPATEGWGLEEIDLDRDGRFIRIDDQCRTSMRGVYAIGT